MDKKTVDKRPPTAPIRKGAPAETPEQFENQLVAGAMELARRQISEGTASAQVITHFLKLGTAQYQLELAKLTGENELLKGKVEQLKSQANTEDLYKRALKAMSMYQGRDEEFDDGDFDDGGFDET